MVGLARRRRQSGGSRSADDAFSVRLDGSRSLDSRVAFTRASNAACFDRLGKLQTVANGMARFEYDPISLAPMGLLIEEQKANLLLRSEEFDNASWSKLNATVDADSEVALDGNITSDKLVENSDTSSQHRCTQSVSGTTENAVLTFSVFAKAEGRNWIRLANRTKGNVTLAAYFNLSDGTVGTVSNGVTAGIEHIVGGIYRCSHSLNVGTGGSSQLAQLHPASADNTVVYDGDGSSGIRFWGAQMEESAFPTSYIATAGVTVARNADAATITLSDIEFDTGNNSGFIEARTAIVGGTQTLISIDDGTINERIYIERNSSDEIHLLVVDGGVTQADLNFGVVADNTVFKLAYRASANDFAGCLDGAAVITDTSGTMPTLTTKRYGRDHASANYWNRTIMRDSVWSHKQPNARLQALTK